MAELPRRHTYLGDDALPGRRHTYLYDALTCRRPTPSVGGLYVNSPLQGDASRPVCRWMGAPMIGPRASVAVTSGVSDYTTFGDASTPRGPREASRSVCRWMGVPMIGPRVSSVVTSGVPNHPNPGGALTRPAEPTKPTPLPFTRTDLTDRGKGKVSGTRR